MPVAMVCTGQTVGTIYSSRWSWWDGVYEAAVECGYRQVLRQTLEGCVKEHGAQMLAMAFHRG